MKAAQIGVRPQGADVTPPGPVETHAEKHATGTAALRVKAVTAEVSVKLAIRVQDGDAQIAEAASDRLAWNAAVRTAAVKVAVFKGWLTLTGQVQWPYQHDEAAAAVRTLWGVTGVSNLITIKSTANAGDIKSDIMEALNRSRFTPGRIAVTADDGKVTLTGTVDYWDARALAGTVAWAASGVTSVTNDIRVN